MPARPVEPGYRVGHARQESGGKDQAAPEESGKTSRGTCALGDPEADRSPTGADQVGGNAHRFRLDARRRSIGAPLEVNLSAKTPSTSKERLYDGEFDDVKTEAGNRFIPLDSRGQIDEALNRAWKHSKFHQPDDLVFCTRDGKPLERRNLLRHLKKAAKDLGLPKTLDFRSFRTMHSSLMRREGVRLEVVRDNMGHSEIATTANIYSKSWLDERADAVTRVVGRSDEEEKKENGAENASGRLFSMR